MTPRLRRLQLIAVLAAVVVLVAAISCRGGGDTPTPTGVPTPAPTATPSASVTPEPTPTLVAGQTATPTPSQIRAGTTAPTAPTPTVSPLPTPTLGPTPTPTPEPRGTVTLAMPGEPPNLNVMDRATIEGQLAADSLGDRLLVLNFESLQLEPWLARGWEMLAPERWRFFLRDGVVFHNGEPFDARAAAWAIDWQGDPTNTSNAARFFQNTTTTVVDRLTIEVRCAQACPILPERITQAHFQAPLWAEKNPADFARLNMSNGPYRLSRWDEGESILLTAFPDYWRRDITPIPEATIVWVRDAGIRAVLVATDEVQWAYDIGLDGTQRVPRWVSTETASTMAIKLDARFDPLTSNRRVRHALAMAVDCPTLVSDVMGGLGTCRGTPFHPSFLKGGADFPPFAFDPGGASRLLEEADAIGAELELYVSDQGFIQGDLWDGIADYWKEAGLDVRVITTSGRDLVGLWEQGGYPPGTDAPARLPVQAIGFTHVNDLLDPSASLIFLTCEEFHASFYCNPGVEARVRQAGTLAGEERTKIMGEVSALLRQELPILWWMSLHRAYGIAADLRWSPRPDGMVRIDTMRYL